MKDRLVFEIREAEVNKCKSCDLSRVCGSLMFSCDAGARENYKLVEEEPKPIPTKYEWKKERLETVNKHILSCMKETGLTPLNLVEDSINLLKWLEENKPENWQPCTKENTKVGDTVRVKQCIKVFKNIEHIFTQVPCGTTENCVVNSIESGGSYPSILSGYEINIAEK